MMTVALWGGYFTMKDIEFGSDGIHISLNSVLWPSPGFQMNKFLIKQLIFLVFISYLALNEEHSMVEVYIKMNANKPNKNYY